MRADERFLRQPKSFWANVRTISESLGYTARGTGRIRVNTISEISSSLESLGLSSLHVIDEHGVATELGVMLRAYFEHRAQQLNETVKPALMDLVRAREVYHSLHAELIPTWPTPMNKQKGDKKGPAYFTGIVNILIESYLAGRPCTYAPRQLTTFTRGGLPLRTFARWVDGAFPSVVSPVAVWEIKEYYHTTSFGSRVAGGVYETLLDGLEIEELREHEGIDVKHYLMVDGYLTWWDMGKSYLCRMVDMLHMGYVDEVLFGYQAVDELPRIVGEWVALADGRVV